MTDSEIVLCFPKVLSMFEKAGLELLASKQGFMAKRDGSPQYFDAGATLGETEAFLRGYLVTRDIGREGIIGGDDGEDPVVVDEAEVMEMDLTALLDLVDEINSSAAHDRKAGLDSPDLEIPDNAEKEEIRDLVLDFARGESK